MLTTPKERFDYAVNIILDHEGGYTNDPHDPGGETAYGITDYDINSSPKELGLPAHLKDLTIDDAKRYYKSEWWDKYGFNDITSLPIATKIFDMAVDMGASEAFKLVQYALIHCGEAVVVDSILGLKTIAAINELYLFGCDGVFKEELVMQSTDFYEQIVSEKPMLKEFLPGWLARAKDK